MQFTSQPVCTGSRYFACSDRPA